MGCLEFMLEYQRKKETKGGDDDLKRQISFFGQCNMTHKSKSGTYVDNPAVPPFISIDRLRVSYDMFSKFITTPETCEHLLSN